MHNVTIEELFEIEAQDDPSIVFHGTASCFAEQIERQGWPVNWRPYDWADIEFIIAWGQKVGINANAFLQLNYECHRKRLSTGLGAYFTYLLEGARQYSGATGGETVRNALRLAVDLEKALSGKHGHEHDFQKVRTLIKTWKAWVFESTPIVYAVRATDAAFPDEEFGGLVSRSGSSFAWQRANSRIVEKAGDFWAVQTIPPCAIIAKATLNGFPVEAL